MRVVLVAAGSHGDINPFIAIGRMLQSRGHDATVLVNSYFENQVTEAGLKCAPLGEYMDLRRWQEDFPNLMHPRKCNEVALEQLFVTASRAAYHAIHAMHAQQRIDVVMHHFAVWGAEWACEELGIPCVHGVLAPLHWASCCEPLVGTAWTPDNSPRMFHGLSGMLALPLVEWWYGAPPSRLRAELGLPRRKNLHARSMRGGILNLGLWSPVLRGRLADDPLRGEICGFAWYDRHGEAEAPAAELQAFLDGGSAPVLFTLGTAVTHGAQDFYVHASDACARLGVRGLLLTGRGRAPPPNLPRGVHAAEYAPYSAVMKCCAVNVHHGGIGTTGQAMRMGRPTVVVPQAFDQWDNAARVKRLGISETLRLPRVTGKRLADVLSRVIGNAAMEARAAEVARLMANEDGAAVAADKIEQLVPHARGTGASRNP